MLSTVLRYHRPVSVWISAVSFFSADMAFHDDDDGGIEPFLTAVSWPLSRFGLLDRNDSGDPGLRWCSNFLASPHPRYFLVTHPRY